MELVFLRESEPKTTTLAISDGTDNEHKSVLQLVRNYIDDLSEFGLVAFEMRPRSAGQHGGGDVEYAILNEPQATLLLTYMRNSDIVRQFKKNLIKAFFAMRDQLREQHGEIKRVDIEHNRTRRMDNPHGIDIKYSLDLTKIVMNPTRAGLDVLEKLTGLDMSEVDFQPASADSIFATLACFIAETCRQEPASRIVCGKIYAAYVHWLSSRGNEKPITKISFMRHLNEMGYKRIATGGNTWASGLQLAAG
ncbi:MAG: Rha family transcriptional regulator [Deltaproteobacteria bacterium]|nr:Rha family transcriptional regulator [Deltaproteobacteria bacterium]